MGVDCIVQMDADYSHNPGDIPRLVEAAKDADMVIGSRYVKGGATEGWPLSRRIISKTANLVARLVLGLPIYDCTCGFKCFRRSTLESIDLDDVRPKRLRLHLGDQLFLPSIGEGAPGGAHPVGR